MPALSTAVNYRNDRAPEIGSLGRGPPPRRLGSSPAGHARSTSTVALPGPVRGGCEGASADRPSIGSVPEEARSGGGEGAALEDRDHTEISQREAPDSGQERRPSGPLSLPRLLSG